MRTCSSWVWWHREGPSAQLLANANGECLRESRMRYVVSAVMLRTSRKAFSGQDFPP